MTNETIDVYGIELGTGSKIVWPEAGHDDYVQACFEGEKIANALVQVMQDRGDPTILGYMLEAIISKGRYGGLEIGFASALAQKLI